MTSVPPSQPQKPAELSAALQRARRPGFGDAWRLPLDGMDGTAGERFACRAVAATFGRQVLGIENAEAVAKAKDPFILALNHSQRLEAVVIPAWLALLRGGRRVHFMADWNFLLLPLVGYVIRAGRSIIVGRKPAKPAFFNRFKSRLVPAEAPMQQAKRLLLEGHSVGIFAEGTTNRNPRRLLRGLSGAARLSLTTGAPIVPAGISFPHHDGVASIGDFEPFTIRFGAAIAPSPLPEDPAEAAAAEHALHCRVMTAISALSGKHWSPENPRTKHAN